MIIKRKKHFFKIMWLFIRYPFGKKKPHFLSWCFDLAKDKNSSWYKDRELLAYLLETAIDYDDEPKLCALHNEFKQTFKELNFSEKHLSIMQEACKKINTPETTPFESNRIDLININSNAGLINRDE